MKPSSADGEMNSTQGIHASETDDRRGVSWLWWGVLAAFVAVVVLSIVSALRRGDHGTDRNRGPATEAAPGAAPTRDIDRSRAP